MPHFLRVLAADPRHFPKFMRYGANAERAHPADRHWYLVVAGVRPEAQRQGLGSRLMRHELDAADIDGIPVYLETAGPGKYCLLRTVRFHRDRWSAQTRAWRTGPCGDAAPRGRLRGPPG